MTHPVDGFGQAAAGEYLPTDAGAAVAVDLPTSFGHFRAYAYPVPGGWTYLALVLGDVRSAEPVLLRLHSECLTGDVLGSLRCDCGPQLRAGLRAVAAEGRGMLLYLTGQEGRGIGLLDKLRAYVEQERGADTVDANLRLGLPADRRDYREAAAVLRALGVRTVVLLTNNPAKVSGLRRGGVRVADVRPLPTAAHTRNRAYLGAKQVRFGHASPQGARLASPGEPTTGAPVDIGPLLGEVRARIDRPYLAVKYAQSADGRIATASGDSKWISGEAERATAHALRAACDAVLVGAGTVLRDDPELTVRLVPGASPLRVVVDGRLRVPSTARIFDEQAPTLVLTTERAPASRIDRLAGAGVAVRVVPGGPDGRVDLAAGLAVLHAAGVGSLLVEGGSQVITSLLAGGHVDRLIASVSPMVLGAGVEAVGRLGTQRVTDGIRLTNRCTYDLGDDVLLAWDVVAPDPTASRSEPRESP